MWRVLMQDGGGISADRADVNSISAKDVDLRRTQTSAERVNARAVEMGHADVEELAADEAHIRGPLQPRRFRCGSPRSVWTPGTSPLRTSW
jgi:hypothetical protein